MRAFTLIPLALLLASAPAQAGLGTTIGMGTDNLGRLFGNNVFDPGPSWGVSAGGFLPTLDWRADRLVLQFHVLETVDALLDEELFLGANVYYQVHQAEVAAPWAAVVQPGGGLDIWGDPFVLALTGECRVGLEAQGAARFGVYVVPALGIAVGDDDADLIAAGTLQIGLAF